MLEAMFSFPAVILSVLLLIVLFYWMLVIVGALDLELPFLNLSGANLFNGLLSLVGLGGVPFAISLSLIVLASWGLVVMATAWLIQPLDSVWRYPLGGLLLAAGLFLGLPLAALLLYPLRGFFVSRPLLAAQDLVGKICVISTSEVDEGFGQAVYRQGGTHLTLAVRANSPNPLKNGDKALIVDYNPKNYTYQVAFYQDGLE